MTAVLSDEIELKGEESCLMKATQQIFQNVCKRMRLSCNGTKAVIVQRLENMGAKTRQEAEQLAHKFNSEGPIPAVESFVATSVRTREPT